MTELSNLTKSFRLVISILISLLSSMSSTSRVDAIVNGNDAPALYGQVQLWVNRNYNCTGTLISPKWVLIAKHCLFGATTQNSLIILGDRRLSEGDTHTIASFQLHPNADAALIELATASNRPDLVVGYGIDVPPITAIISLFAWGALASGEPASFLQYSILA